jgi:hypothetical protein
MYPTLFDFIGTGRSVPEAFEWISLKTGVERGETQPTELRSPPTRLVEILETDRGVVENVPICAVIYVRRGSFYLT